MFFSMHANIVVLVAAFGAFCIEKVWYSSLFYGKEHRKRSVVHDMRKDSWKGGLLLFLSLIIQSGVLYALAFEAAFNFYVTALLLWCGYTMTHSLEYYMDSHTSKGDSLHFVFLKLILFLFIATVFQIS
jgi:hypothetical protein